MIAMMMMKNIKKQLFIYIILDIFIFIFSIFKGYVWILNTQIAFLSSLCIILLSFLSYVKNVNKQVKLVGDLIDDRDIIDELNDPYELYEDTNTKAKKRAEKIKISMKNLSKSKGGAVSFLRLIGYLILIAGFFLLVKIKLFLVIPYIIGISIVPVGGLINAIYQR